MVAESVEVQDSRETRSYFCALIEVIVKVSSKRMGSDMMAVGCDIAVPGQVIGEWDGRLSQGYGVLCDGRDMSGIEARRLIGRECEDRLELLRSGGCVSARILAPSQKVAATAPQRITEEVF